MKCCGVGCVQAPWGAWPGPLQLAGPASPGLPAATAQGNAAGPRVTLPESWSWECSAPQNSHPLFGVAVGWVCRHIQGKGRFKALILLIF